MTNTVLYLFNLFLPTLYLGVFLLYLFLFLRPDSEKRIFNFSLAKAGLFTLIVAHLIYSTLLTHKNGLPPIASTFQVMSLIALTLTITYALIETTSNIQQTGAFVLGVSLVFQIISSSLLDNQLSPDPALKNVLMQFHIINALLGYGAIAIAGIYSILYLLLLKQIQSNQYGLLFDRLPNLEIMERLSYTSVFFGFIFLTFAFAGGAWMIIQNQEKLSFFSDPKLIGTILVWGFYGAGLLFRKRFRLQGKKMALLLIFGFLFAFLSMTVLNLFSAKFHGN
ncbi:MAG: cytochrome c biogenesis protein CcsA [Chloroherpetonaceae bacterium]|nr:cytochrome c biogenesis protein CcsA [Chloroherpetonaceae bacterium]